MTGLFIILMAASCFANQKVVAVVHSYDPDFGWVKEVEKGIFHYKVGHEFFGIQPNEIFKDCRIVKFYMNAKQHQGDIPYLKNIGYQIIKKLNKIRPDAIIVCDDEALTYVTLPLLNDNRHCFVFLGVNNDPKDYGIVKNYTSPEKNVTGLISEHPFFYSVKLAIKIVPNYKNIIVFFDKSPSGKGILSNFNREINRLEDSIRRKIQKTIVSNDWEQWKRIIISYQNPQNLFVFGTFYTLRNKFGKYVSTKDVAKWIEKKSNVPDITILTNHISEGFLMAISNPGFVHGYEACEKVVRVLHGTPIRKIPIEVPKRKAVHINMERARHLNLNIPVEIIAISKYYDELGY
jgi:ABC-type uncharacterized transport system substrate-binding protein